MHAVEVIQGSLQRLRLCESARIRLRSIGSMHMHSHGSLQVLWFAHMINNTGGQSARVKRRSFHVDPLRKYPNSGSPGGHGRPGPKKKQKYRILATATATAIATTTTWHDRFLHFDLSTKHHLPLDLQPILQDSGTP